MYVETRAWALNGARGQGCKRCAALCAPSINDLRAERPQFVAASVRDAAIFASLARVKAPGRPIRAAADTSRPAAQTQTGSRSCRSGTIGSGVDQSPDATFAWGAGGFW